LTFYVTHTSKNTSLKMATIGGRNMEEARLYTIQTIYITVQTNVGRNSHNESSVHGHEPFSIQNLAFFSCKLLGMNSRWQRAWNVSYTGPHSDNSKERSLEQKYPVVSTNNTRNTACPTFL